MISDEEAKKLAKSYLGINSRLANTSEQMLYERIELLELKVKNTEKLLTKIVEYLKITDKSSET